MRCGADAMTRVLNYKGPEPHVGPPPAPPLVRLARAALVVLILGQAFSFASDFAVRARVLDEFEDAWDQSELIRRGHERERRALGYPPGPPPASPPRKPVLRLALLPALAWMRAPFTLAALVFALGMSRGGWPDEPPRWLVKLAGSIVATMVVVMLATLIGDGVELAPAPVVVTSLRLIASIASFGVVAPALYAKPERD